LYSNSVKLTFGSTAYSGCYGDNSISSAACLEVGRYIEIIAIKVSHRRFNTRFSIYRIRIGEK